ncbi:integral membrane protein [Massariosphaeria phaeospora]|uniref:Integral membrane protein n=1 Tax=Massariosphaeria phaeospora TaxID=100035 RepID=A0A7C8I1C5_9PLEO|nr:integral membrane protein [Massariosphaeria phaeospora]
MGKATESMVRMRVAKPIAIAYILGLLSATGPRFIKVLLLLGNRKLSLQAAWLQSRNILLKAVEYNRFPAFCGVLIGGSTLLQVPIKALIIALLRVVRSPNTVFDGFLARRLARFIATIVSASVAFRLLNSTSLEVVTPNRYGIPQPLNHLQSMKPRPFEDPPEWVYRDGVDDRLMPASSVPSHELAGRTMDLTLFSVVRALDIVVSSVWNRLAPQKSSQLHTIARSTPVTLFSFSAATIMYAWFYSPSRLPQAYNTWISAAAELDHRLILALRHARYGTWVYGRDTGMAPLLGSMCRDHGLPVELGDPARTCPIPCEVVHMGWSKSCEKHALIRFCKGWVFAAKMYAPIQVFVLARHIRAASRPGSRFAGLSRAVLLRALVDMTRSSAFLGTFIAFFYYGVCLSRTRLGPTIFSNKTVTPQMWDSGLCVLVGCLLCGSSLLVEQSKKRLEIVLFVLPRAAATWFPRRYLPEHRWKEHVAFTLSAAVLLTTAQEDSTRVRGMLGSVLHGIMKTD